MKNCGHRAPMIARIQVFEEGVKQEKVEACAECVAYFEYQSEKDGLAVHIEPIQESVVVTALKTVAFVLWAAIILSIPA